MSFVSTRLKGLDVGDLIFANVIVDIADLADSQSQSATTTKIKKMKPVRRICIVLEPGTSSVQVTYVATFNQSVALPITLDKAMWYPFIPATKESDLKPLPALNNYRAQWASLRAKHTITRDPVEKLPESVPLASVNVIKEKIKRNLFSSYVGSRVTGIPPGDPERAFAIINFATGYYLTLSSDKQSVIFSPETVETSSAQQAYQWVISKDSQGDYTLSNQNASTGFAFTKSQGVDVYDPVTYGDQTQGNTLFTIVEAATGEKGCYTISPKLSTTLTVAVKTQNDDVPPSQLAQAPALLAPRDENSKFGLWVLMASDSKGDPECESSRASAHVHVEGSGMGVKCADAELKSST